MENTPSNYQHSSTAVYEKGRRRVEVRQAKCSTAAYVRSNLLKNKVWPVSTSLPSEFKDSNKVEKEFFNSFSYICRLYNLNIKNVRHYPFPYNMSLSYTMMRKRLSELNLGLQVVMEKKKVCLATYKEVKRCEKQRFLAFAPILKYMKQPGRKHASELLLSVCSYLRYIVDVPIFGIGYNTSVDKIIDFIEEDLYNGYYDDEDEDQSYFNHLENYFQSAYYHMRLMERKWSKAIHLGEFEMRLERLKPRDKEERMILKMAKKAFRLYRHNAEITFEDNYPYRLKDPHIELRVDRSYYFCFYYSFHPHIDSELENQIDNFFPEDEERVTDEPVVYQIFDRPHRKEQLDTTNIDSLLNVLYELYDLLNLLNEKYN